MQNKVSKRIFKGLCLIGFIVQSTLLAIEYFSYKTATKVSISTKAVNRAPTVTYCGRYIDLILTDRLKKEKGINITRFWETKNVRRRAVYYDQASKLTVKDIFDYTPSLNSSLFDCVIRDATGRRHVFAKILQMCQNSFVQSKFYMQSFMCYNFAPKESVGSFEIGQIAHSYAFEKGIYALYLPLVFTTPEILYVVLGPEEVPYLSRAYGAYIRTRVTTANDIMIQNRVTEIHLLPPPYDTMCIPDFNYSSHSQCITEKMKSLNRVPNTEIIREPHDVHHVLLKDEQNLTMRLAINQIEEECKITARRDRCQYSFAETYVQLAGGSDFMDQMRLRVMGPQAPNTIVTSNPAFTASEFFLYLFSCMGTWMGVSIVHLNPLLLISFVLQFVNDKRQLRKKAVLIFVTPPTTQTASVPVDSRTSHACIPPCTIDF